MTNFTMPSFSMGDVLGMQSAVGSSSLMNQPVVSQSHSFYNLSLRMAVHSTIMNTIIANSKASHAIYGSYMRNLR